MSLIPWHWALSGPSRRRDAANVLRSTNVRGGHAATFRRLVRIGPWGFYVVRYRPRPAEEADHD